MITQGLFARIEVKPGQEEAMSRLLSSALALAQQESGTVTWYALRLGPSSFGIFDTFATDAARVAHLEGPIPAALRAHAELLQEPPSIERLEVLAAKLAG